MSVPLTDDSLMFVTLRNPHFRLHNILSTDGLNVGVSNHGAQSSQPLTQGGHQVLGNNLYSSSFPQQSQRQFGGLHDGLPQKLDEHGCARYKIGELPSSMLIFDEAGTMALLGETRKKHSFPRGVVVFFHGRHGQIGWFTRVKDYGPGGESMHNLYESNTKVRFSKLHGEGKHHFLNCNACSCVCIFKQPQMYTQILQIYTYQSHT
jgi:hypothetical protein